MEKEIIQTGATHTPPSDPHTFRIQGKVTIKQGDEVIAECKDNHMVNQGLKGFASFLCCQSYYGDASQTSVVTVAGPAYGWTIRLGNDVTTITTAPLADLVTKLSTLTPMLTTGSDITQGVSDTTYWYIRRTALFAPAAYTGTIGEVGLYANMPSTLGNKWVTGTITPALRYPAILIARFSVGDGDFTSFSYPQNTSLTIEWEIGVSP